MKSISLLLLSCIICFACNEDMDRTSVSKLEMPEENRFSKQVLDFNLNEPMELDELGDRGIIFIERQGVIKLYEYETEQTKILDTIAVHYKNEDGLLGMAVDPNYTENQWIYLFYSPDIEASIQHVSRFTLKNDKLSDEKIMLEIPLIRQCCHSGGYLKFSKDGLLYVGVGDNTNPFESSGFAPIDERKDRQLYDAQKSAANTNDLRGKILRIKPEPDGSYSIPKGNLFPEGTKDCRPEIFVMGCRNPFRFSIDSRTNYVYWGDVGPDAGEADSLRGPAGMGEFNQAKQPGFYGWPYSRGNNQMYHDYDFVTSQSLATFVPDQIINDSPNNTGIAELPPIQESMLWYSYAKSEEFPWIGDGGVNPMSGPIYHAEDYENTSLPNYFEDKWFVYEWMRDWIYVVELDNQQAYVKAEQFMPSTEFSHPMDMMFSKDGKFYILEYGQKWNTRNLDARLCVINFNDGNRPPIAEITVDKVVGAAPLQVNLSAANSHDYDEDELQFEWRINGQEINSSSTQLNHTFNTPGNYDVALTVTDTEGESATTNKKILVGNEPPKIKISLGDQNTTYWNNKKIDYKIEVTDLEDGTTGDTTIDPANVKVTFNYIPEGEDMILASIGHQQNAVPRGLAFIQDADCEACHAEQKKVAGPSYQDIAKRYTQDDKQKLIHSIIKGSQGTWGETMMSPHPQLDIESVDEMINYILSLNPNKKVKEKHLPIAGTITFDKHKRDKLTGKYVLMVSYLDEGNPDVVESSLSAIEEFVFIPPRIQLEDAVALHPKMSVWNAQKKTVVGSIKHGRDIKLATISFDQLKSLSIAAVFNKDYLYQGTVEVRKGNKDGKLIGSKTIEHYSKDKSSSDTYEIEIEPSTGLDTLVLVFSNPNDEDQFTMNGDWVQLNYSPE